MCKNNNNVVVFPSTIMGKKIERTQQTKLKNVLVKIRASPVEN